MVQNSAATVVVHLDSYRKKQRKTLTDMEGAIERAKNQAAERAMKELLAELGSEDSSPKPCPSCAGAVAVHSQHVQRIIRSLHGEHVLERNYHYCRKCRLGFCPRDAALGLPPDGMLTLEMERRVLDFAVSAAYEECAERWSMHYPNHPLSATQFRQVVERVGKRAELADARLL